ncbi:MAG TPA: nitroreductase family protein [Myxococcales bacterium]|nr:nitroreductase family protein [Myxococcales bacterium]
MDVREALEQRRAIKQFDPEQELTDAELRRLLEPVLLTPTSYNLQHYRFVVVRKKELKNLLCEAAFNQLQVRDCSAVVVVTAKLNAHEDAPQIYDHLPPEITDKLVSMTASFYANAPQLQRDEAMRSGSLASMTLMLVASERGWDTCPMIGYDPAKIAVLLDVPIDHAIVMMICVDKATLAPRERAARYKLSDVACLESFEGDRFE